jgi:hypothetical protein
MTDATKPNTPTHDQNKTVPPTTAQPTPATSAKPEPATAPASATAPATKS